MFKNHHNILGEESYLAQVINNEDQLDHTRTKLIKDASEQLQTRTDHLTSVLNKIQGQDTNKAIMRQGVERLQELAKAFALVGQLEQGVLMGKVEPVSVRRLAAEVIEPLSAQFKEKKVKVEVSGFDAALS